MGGALLAGGLVSTSVEFDSGEGVAAPWTPPPADGSSGVVVGTYKSKAGLNIFGLTFTPATWEAQVMFVPPPGCEPDGTEVVATGACAGIPAEGKYAGGGTAPDGSPLMTVAIEISRKCHEALRYGDGWPAAYEACQ
jgi:hypothetical protein